MQVALRRRSGQALNQAIRTLSSGTSNSSSTAASEGSKGTDRWRPKHRTQQNSATYDPWAREVYGRKAKRNQTDGVQPQAAQHAGDERPRRQLGWQPRSKETDLLRINYTDASTAMMSGAE
jgi:hypothetical protein